MLRTTWIQPIVESSWPKIPDISARAAAGGFLKNSSITNMAAEKCVRSWFDYLQLNSLWSVVLFDTARKKGEREKLYVVEIVWILRLASHAKFLANLRER